MSDWINEPEDISQYEGFVYLITNLTNDKKYIGQKKFWNRVTRRALKGRSKAEKEKRATLKGNKRHSKRESDWRTYNGSCKELLVDIDKGHQIKKEIIMLCKTKWDMSYYEAKLQISLDVLLRDDYYNGIVNCRLCKRKI